MVVNDSSSNFSHIPWTNNEKILLTISYSSSILLSSAGNLLVLLVFRAGVRRSKNKKTRQSDIRQFLLNLAISDLLISLFCLPFTFTYILLWNWPFPIPICKLVLAIQVLSVTASAVTNMVIGLDRFWVVIYPMKPRITRNKSGIVISLIWVVSCLFAIPELVVAKTKFQKNGYRDCIEDWLNDSWKFGYTLFLLLMTYVIPLVVLTFTYCVVGLRLWKRDIPGEADHVRDANHMRSKIKVIKMLAIIVVCFGLCWMPLHVFWILENVTSVFSRLGKYAVNILYVICHWIAMANSFVNPLLYSIMNDSFQDDMKWLFKQNFCVLCPNYPVSNTANTISRMSSVTYNVNNNDNPKSLDGTLKSSNDESIKQKTLQNKHTQFKVPLVQDSSIQMVTKDPENQHRENSANNYQLYNKIETVNLNKNFNLGSQIPNVELKRLLPIEGPLQIITQL